MTKTKKASAKKTAAAKKPAAKKKPTATKKDPAAPQQGQVAPFREVRNWSDCKDQKLLIHHPALGDGPEPNGYHKAKVLNVDLTAGSVLVFVATKALKGRYLLPIDSAAAKVK